MTTTSATATIGRNGKGKGKVRKAGIKWERGKKKDRRTGERGKKACSGGRGEDSLGYYLLMNEPETATKNSTKNRDWTSGREKNTHDPVIFYSHFPISSAVH